MRATYFGTWERGYPRNEQVVACLRKAGVDVDLCHVEVWTGEHKFRLGAGSLPRIAAAELRLAFSRVSPTDVLIVGYPGHLDVLSARRHGKPVVFNAMVSLHDTLVSDRALFATKSLRARALRAIDRAALRSADIVVADTDANATYLAELADIEKPSICFVGAEERLFRQAWQPPEKFSALFVGKLIPLHGLEVILGAARLLPDVPFTIVGSGQLESMLRDLPANVEHVAWVDYTDLPSVYAHSGCALGVFGASAKTDRVIPNKVFQALAVGAPVITSDTAGARELLTDDVDSLLVDPSPEALSSAIRRMRDETGLAQRLGGEGRKTFEREASERVLGDRWKEILNRAVQNAGQR
jgi:glycosyltransferase involved in cell wall biosynthesis